MKKILLLLAILTLGICAWLFLKSYARPMNNEWKEPIMYSAYQPIRYFA